MKSSHSVRGSVTVCFALLTAPSGVPEMFEAVAGQRQVNFSWSPPRVALRNGVITSYTLSCSPSPSSLPQSPSQSGPLTVAGFSPDTSYSCSVVANNGLGSGPPASTTFTTQQDCKACRRWNVHVSKFYFILCRFILPATSWWSDCLFCADRKHVVASLGKK